MSEVQSIDRTIPYRNLRVYGQKLSLLVLSGLLLLMPIGMHAGKPVVHDFHSALTSIVYDSQAKQYEITIRVFSDDLEAALKRQANKLVKIESAEGEAVLMSYLQKTFRIRNTASHTINWTFVGLESGPESSSIYLEYHCGRGGKLQVTNKLFMELFEDQRNIVNVIQGAQNQSHLFTTSETSHDFEG